MKANMMSLHTPTTPGVGSKGHFFSLLNMAMLHIKLKLKKCRPTYKLTLFEFTHTPNLLGLVLRSDIEIVKM